MLLAVVVTVGFAALLPPHGRWVDGEGPYLGLGPVGLAASVSVLAVLRRWRTAAILGLVGVAVLVPVYLHGPPQASLQQTVALAWTSVWLCVFGIPMTMSTRWMIDVVRRLWRSRQVMADLAVAQERLRFSRDLHDVFGRTLSTVAIKSELAAELARRGDPRAVAEMVAVHELAHSAQSEVRGIVRAYRHIDLAEEVGGARSVLDSAGIAIRTVGFDDASIRAVHAAVG